MIVIRKLLGGGWMAVLEKFSTICLPKTMGLHDEDQNEKKIKQTEVAFLPIIIK